MRPALFLLCLTLVVTGCPSNNNAAPPVTDPPVVTGPADGLSGDGGTPFVVTASATNSPTAWSWDFGGGAEPNTSTDQTPNVVFGRSGSYTGTVTATNAAGTSAPLTFNYSVRGGWARHLGGELSDPLISDIAVDDVGNLYILGVVDPMGTLITLFIDDPEADIAQPLGPLPGVQFLLSYDSVGDFRWYTDFDDPYPFRFEENALANDGDGVLIAATLRIDADLDPGSGNVLGTRIDETNAALVRIGDDGLFDWGVVPDFDLVNPGDESGYAALSSAGGIWFAGQRMTTNGARAHLLRLNSGGTVLQNYSWGGLTEADDASASPAALGADSVGNCYVAGLFRGMVDFDPGAAAVMRDGLGPTQHTTLQKFAPDGTFQWLESWPTGLTQAPALAVALDGRSYVASPIINGGDLDPSASTITPAAGNGQDIGLSALAADGSFLWARTWGAGDDDLVIDVIPAVGGGAILAGGIRGTIDFDGIGTLGPNSTARTLLLRTDTAGQAAWVREWAPDPHENQPFEYSAHALAGSPAGILYLVAPMGESVDVAPGPAETVPISKFPTSNRSDEAIYRLLPDGQWEAFPPPL